MHVLVTGAFGNIGSHTAAEVLRQGHRLRCFDLPSRAARRQAARLRGSAEIFWGDIRDGAAVERAVRDVDAVLHLAAVIPPGTDENVAQARAVNVVGTGHVVDACRTQPRPPRLLFTSSFDVYGNTVARLPPRSVGDPVQATDAYTEHKLAAEALVRAAPFDWCIFRLSDVPIIGLRRPHPIMFEIGLHNRIEAMHPDDAARALVGALAVDAVWGRELLVGGGPRCQVTYREYLHRLCMAMGIDPPPDHAFSSADYVTDWLDTAESERLLRYQRHSFDDIVAEVAACLGWRRLFVPLARPFLRRWLLSMSRHARGAVTTED